MNVLILEDELPARAKLELMLGALDPSIHVTGKLGSVRETLKWLAENPEPNLAFVDIQLSDDHSFEIFRRHPVQFPVIFTTAYDKYLLESFEFNSIDYLLKPITEDKLRRALEKAKRLQQHFQSTILELIKNLPRESKRNRILAQKGTEFVTLNLDDIAYFYSAHKIVFIRDFSGRQLIADRNLGEYESYLDAQRFFRLNRKYIAHIKSIDRFKSDNGRILVSLTPETKEQIYVSKETAPEFRKWMGGL